MRLRTPRGGRDQSHNDTDTSKKRMLKPPNTAESEKRLWSSASRYGWSLWSANHFLSFFFFSLSVCLSVCVRSQAVTARLPIHKEFSDFWHARMKPAKSARGGAEEAECAPSDHLMVPTAGESFVSLPVLPSPALVRRVVSSSFLSLLSDCRLLLSLVCRALVLLLRLLWTSVGCNTAVSSSEPTVSLVTERCPFDSECTVCV